MNIEIKSLESAGEARTCAEFMAGSEPWLTLGRTFDDCLKLLCEPGKEIFVAHAEKVLAGFIVLQLRGAFTGYIQTIGVIPEWRNCGIGTRLIKFAEERIFRESKNVFLCVSSFNTEAQKLYQRLGYKRVGELKDYIVRGHSEILMRKTIGPIISDRFS